MKELILSLLIFVLITSFCTGQDTIVFRNGKKITGKIVSLDKKSVKYTLPPDTILKKSVSVWRLEYVRYAGGTTIMFNQPIDKRQLYRMQTSTTSFYLSADVGFTVPAFAYRDAIAGNQADIKATWFFNRKLGVVLRAGEDINATGLDYVASNDWGGFYKFNYYLAGIHYRLGGKPGFPWYEFTCLAGYSSALNPTTESGGGVQGITLTTPGTGYGVGYYAGMEFTSSANHLCSVTFGIGYFGAYFSYPHFMSSYTNLNSNTNTIITTATNSTATKYLGLFQANLGINFRLKKGAR